jgi:hypothetical protein
MICKKCGYFNWPYVSKCRHCQSALYNDFWEGHRLREMFFFIFILSSISIVPVSFKFAYSGLSIIIFAIGIVMRVLFGMITITYLKKRIINNCYLLSNKSNYLPIMIMGILISLFFITVPILSEDIYNSIITPLIIMCWIGTSLSFLWLIYYERKNGSVIICGE